jgi:hypothetical protein
MEVLVFVQVVQIPEELKEQPSLYSYAAQLDKDEHEDFSQMPLVPPSEV